MCVQGGRGPEDCGHNGPFGVDANAVAVGHSIKGSAQPPIKKSGQQSPDIRQSSWHEHSPAPMTCVQIGRNTAERLHALLLPHFGLHGLFGMNGTHICADGDVSEVLVGVQMPHVAGQLSITRRSSSVRVGLKLHLILREAHPSGIKSMHAAGPAAAVVVASFVPPRAIAVVVSVATVVVGHTLLHELQATGHVRLIVVELHNVSFSDASLHVAGLSCWPQQNCWQGLYSIKLAPVHDR